MATARKQYVRTRGKHKLAPPTEGAEFGCFINDVVDGTIQASKALPIRDGQNRLVRIDYDDPDGGPGAGKGGAGTRGN
jgi:hypothetical protein